MAIKDIRKHFPIFANNPNIIYFDNSSTTQKPQMVLDAMNDYFTSHTANAGRGNYPWANIVTKKIEEAREKIARFIHAKEPDEIIFTSGATENINTIAFSWGLHNLKNNDEILYSPLDHSSNIYPWINLKQLLKKFNITINLIPYKSLGSGEADTDDILSKITLNTRLIAATHIHNVFGSKTTLEEIITKIPNHVLISMDCSQSIGHTEVNVQELNVDFISFSGHKMFASTGTGILYIDKKHHSSLRPFMLGGNSGVDLNEKEQIITPLQMPQLLEAGTPNIAGIISLGSAIDFISTIGIETVHQHNLELTQYFIEKLKKLSHIEFLPGVALCACEVGYGIVSFQIQGMSSSDVGFILSSHNIFVRTGNHCLIGKGSYADSIRVSFHIYNTKDEVDKLLIVLEEIIKEL